MSIICQPRVLVIDNDPRVGRDLKDLLKPKNHAVMVVEGKGQSLLQAAEQLATEFRPHVVVMDLRLLFDDELTDHSGLELLKKRRFSSAGCILYSAYLDHKIAREALLQANVDDLVGKEESPQRLLDAVDVVARKRSACLRDFDLHWPPAWDSERVLEALFGPDNTQPPDMADDILAQLVPTARTLTLKTLDSSAESPSILTRGRAVFLEAWADELDPFVVKLARGERITMEANSYRSEIEQRLAGHFHADLISDVTFWDLGAISYSFMGSSLRRIKTFAAFYQQENEAGKIIKPLHHFFGEVWRRRYEDTRVPLGESLYEAYDRFLNLRDRLSNFPNKEKKLSFPGIKTAFRNPALWVPEHAADSRVPTAAQAVTHGDLHGDNLFVEGENAWSIDFERSGPGPILRDFACLEVDIVTRLVWIPHEEYSILYELAVLLAIEPFENTPQVPAHLFDYPEVMKALGVIARLRLLARQITGYTDVREYYWGLLFETIHIVTSSASDTSQPQRATLLAAVLCERLMKIDGVWPAESLPSLSTVPLRDKRGLTVLRDRLENRLLDLQERPSKEPNEIWSVHQELSKIDLELSLHQLWESSLILQGNMSEPI